MEVTGMEKIRDSETEARQGYEDIKEIHDAEADAEENIYCKVSHRAEDEYAVTVFDKSQRKQTEAFRRYRAVCLLLGIVCLAQLLAIVLLSVKPQNGACLTGGRRILQTNISREYRCVECPWGWLGFRDSCFYLSKTRLSWEGSRRNCTAAGGDLAVVANTNIQNFLSDVGTHPYWIGLRHNKSLSAWTWVNDSPMTQSYWKENGSNEECVILRGEDTSGKNWLKDSCDSVTYFICQVSL